MNYIDILSRANAGDLEAIKIIRGMEPDDYDDVFDDDMINYIQKTLDQSYSMHFMGIMYDYEKGKKPDTINLLDKPETGYGDHEKAIEWYQKAIDMGNTDAMTDLANMYYDDDRITPDHNKAIELLQKAVQMNNSSAMNNLALIHDNNNNRESAIILLEKAIQLDNDRVAMHNLANIYMEENEKEKAFELYKKSAELGDSDSMFELASIYEADGKYEMAIEWYEKAIESGNPDAPLRLANMYCEGKGIKYDYEKFIQLMEKAIELGCNDAIYGNAYRYHHGYGVEQNYELAIEWYKKAFVAGNNDAVNELISIYQHLHMWIPLAEIYLHLNNPSKFRKCIKKILNTSDFDVKNFVDLIMNDKFDSMYENGKIPKVISLFQNALR